MMTTDQRKALFDTYRDPDATQAAKDEAKRALLQDAEEQRNAQVEANKRFLETYEPRDEFERRTFERAKKTNTHIMNASVPRGWNKRVDGLVDEILYLDPNATFSQFKSKFGVLRVYGTFNEAAQNAVRQAEADCESLCFWCGDHAEDRWNSEPACANHKKGVFDPHDEY